MVSNNRDDNRSAKDEIARKQMQQQLLESLPENLRELAKHLLEKDGTDVILDVKGLVLPKEVVAEDIKDKNSNNTKPPVTFEEKRDYVRDVIIPSRLMEIKEIQSEIDNLNKYFRLDQKNIEFSRKALRAAVIRAKEELPKKVIGQEAAIAPIISALERAAVGIRDLKRPIVSALAVGRTGVGKSLLAKELASCLSKGDKHKFGFLKINCSEYSNGHEGARLTGAPPGYIGFDKPSPLKQIVDNPYQVVLFDEVEKGSGKLHDLFLQILEDGELTLGTGETVSFKNCIILFSSNIGVEALDQALNPFGLPTGKVDEGLSADQVAELTSDALKRVLRPELLNRLDVVVPFRDIDRKSALKIAALEVNYAVERAKQVNPGCEISFNDDLINIIWKKGYSREYGAREIRRTVQKLVEEPLASAMFALEPDEIANHRFNLVVENNKVKVDIIPIDSEPGIAPDQAA